MKARFSFPALMEEILELFKIGVRGKITTLYDFRAQLGARNHLGKVIGEEGDPFPLLVSITAYRGDLLETEHIIVLQLLKTY